MKRILIVALLALAIPRAAWAAEDVFNNERGSIAISYSGIVSRGSQLVYCLKIVPPDGHSLGSVNFSAGPLIKGSLEEGGKFSSTGSSFEVVGRGKYGEPKGVIFSGNFVGPIKWTLINKIGAVLIFKLTGNIEGVFYTGRLLIFETSQTIVTTEDQLAQGIGHIATGRVVFTP
ncbi:MAG: hypothetical protein WA172_12590 [Terriglobales bacterium]